MNSNLKFTMYNVKFRKLINSTFYILHSSRGFTLVEMILYMGLLTIFLVVLTNIFVSMLEVQSESRDTSVVEQDGKFILARLAYDISRADSVISPVSPGDTNSSLSLIIGGDTYSYAINNLNLELTNALGTNSLNGSETDIAGISFQKIGVAGGKHTVKVLMIIESKSGMEARSFQTTLGRR